MLQLPLLLCVLEAQPITRATRDRAENVMRDAFDGTPAPSRASDNDGNTTDLNATRNEVDAASCNGLVKLLVETLPRVPPCRFFMVPLDGGGAAFSNLALGETLRVDPPLPPPMVTRLDGLLGPKVVDPGSGTLSDRIVRLAPPAPFQTVLVSSDWMRVARGAEATAGAGNVFTTDMAVLHVTQIRRGNAAAQYTAAAPSGGGADDAAVVVVRSAAQWRERRWRALDGAFSGLRPRLAPAGTSVGNGGGLRTGLHDGPVALTEPPTVLGVAFVARGRSPLSRSCLLPHLSLVSNVALTQSSLATLRQILESLLNCSGSRVRCTRRPQPATAPALGGFACPSARFWMVLRNHLSLPSPTPGWKPKCGCQAPSRATLQPLTRTRTSAIFFRWFLGPGARSTRRLGNRCHRVGPSGSSDCSAPSRCWARRGTALIRCRWYLARTARSNWCLPAKFTCIWSIGSVWVARKQGTAAVVRKDGPCNGKTPLSRVRIKHCTNPPPPPIFGRNSTVTFVRKGNLV